MLLRRYSLPDGNVIRVGAERSAAPELLFDPGCAGLEAPGLGDLAHSAIQVRVTTAPAVLRALR